MAVADQLQLIIITKTEKERKQRLFSHTWTKHKYACTGSQFHRWQRYMTNLPVLTQTSLLLQIQLAAFVDAGSY